MEPTSYNEIAGWAQDRHAEALVAFRRSCPKLTAGPDVRIATDGGEKTITAGEWARICEAAAGVKTGDARGSRTFFEQNFRPLIVQAPGKFTGYFEPELRGSKVPSRLFTVPVYRKPPDLTDKPYYTRAEIEAGALKGKGLEIAYVQDPVGLFEVQVQGSGRIQLAEGGTMTLGFDGSNNRPYTAIGAVLVEMGAMKKEDATWPAIRDWLKRNPQQAREVMRKNERYIFFRDTRTSAPIGAEGVALTAQRSMAVDPAIHALRHPGVDRHASSGLSQAWRHRTLSPPDDSRRTRGAAIKGPARGDVFYGAGPQAAEWAGRMNSDGRAIILVPNKN
jgi:membrane-bound lytic murein transglycosylase A